MWFGPNTSMWWMGVSHKTNQMNGRNISRAQTGLYFAWSLDLMWKKPGGLWIILSVYSTVRSLKCLISCCHQSSVWTVILRCIIQYDESAVFCTPSPCRCQVTLSTTLQTNLLIVLDIDTLLFTKCNFHQIFIFKCELFISNIFCITDIQSFMPLFLPFPGFVLHVIALPTTAGFINTYLTLFLTSHCL